MRLIESISDYTRTDRLAILWSGDVAIGHDLSGDIGGEGGGGKKSSWFNSVSLIAPVIIAYYETLNKWIT